ncbi:MAG TPA: DUF4365 domain-containing protein [Isosphaeraceae bacterium]|jgi:hypothetical protein|nr:DUF4365 domain-containing protein [Isosphaeraceae bacterium]
MEKTQSWYIEERSRAFALTYLTGHKKLSILPMKEETGLDFMVNIGKGHDHAGRIFGVQIKGRLVAKPSWRKENGALAIPRLLTSMVEAPIPVCIFLFIMKTNESYYRWLKEPVISVGDPELRTRHSGAFKPLNDDVIDAIVDQLERWYDAQAE